MLHLVCHASHVYRSILYILREVKTLAQKQHSSRIFNGVPTFFVCILFIHLCSSSTANQEASSIFEYFLTYNSGHQQLVYRRILEEVQTIAETTPRIKLVSIQDNLTCEVETSTILNITQSILGVMENGGFRWPTIPSAHLISVIYGKAQEEGQHSFVTLRSGSETEDLGIYHVSKIYWSIII